MSENVEDFLEHYGVPGMKWGKRQGRIKSGLAGAALSLNRRDTDMIKRQLSGNSTLSEKAMVAPFKLILGKERVAKNQEKALGDLYAQKERIENGRQTISDKILMYQRVTFKDLAIGFKEHREVFK